MKIRRWLLILMIGVLTILLYPMGFGIAYFFLNNLGASIIWGLCVSLFLSLIVIAILEKIFKKQ